MLAKSADPLLEDQQRFLRIAQESLGVRKHCDLLLWLQGELQMLVPHEALVAAWGDFSLGLIYYEIISTFPGGARAELEKHDISPHIRNLFSRWLAQGAIPFALNFPNDAMEHSGKQGRNNMPTSLLGMRSALIHGIRDQRGRHDCLYVALHSRRIPEESRKRLELFLPYLDTALRQIARQPEYKVGYSSPDEIADKRLTSREIEIMDWVRKGKTNHEIGLILDISEFTVKNHLQRIFRKLDVINRAQAVSAFTQSSRGIRG